MSSYTIPLFLSSSTATGAYGKPSDGSAFSVNFNPAIEIPTRSHVTVKVVEANLWYNTINVSSGLLNNKLYYTDDLANATKYTITIADGIYGLAELNTAVDNAVVANGQTTGLIELIAENATQKVLLKISAAGWQVNMTTADTFRVLIGFDSQKIPAAALTVGSLTTRADNIANFSSLEHILLHSSLGGSAILNGSNSSSLMAITPNVGVGSLIVAQPRHPIEIPINAGSRIDTATFTLTHQDGSTRFNTNGEDWSFRMIINVNKI
jgi:hypothetical protein